MNFGTRTLLPLLVGAFLAPSAGCIITTNTTDSGSGSSDGSASSGGGETTGGTGGSSSTAAPTSGSTGEPGSTGGSTTGPTSGSTSVSSGGPVVMCGWDPNNMYYDCGFEGEDPNGTFPRDCPEGLVEGEACGMVPGQGCCDAEGNSWYCGDDGMGNTSLVKTVCQ